MIINQQYRTSFSLLILDRKLDFKMKDRVMCVCECVCV